jgi:hypothetical protein
VKREGAHRPVPRGQAEEIAVVGETEPVAVKLGVWISNTKAKRDKQAARRATRVGHAVGVVIMMRKSAWLVRAARG